MKFATTCLLALAGTVGATAAHADIYNQGFEDITSSGWILTNNSAPVGQVWYQGVSDIFVAQGGSVGSYASANFLSAVGAGSISNWLISPEIALGGATSLSFYVRTEATSGYQDAVNVYFHAGADSTTASFTTLVTAITAAQGWTQYTVALPAAATGRIAFEYAVANADNANVVGVDSISISAVPEPGTYALMGLGVAGLALLARRRRPAV